MRPRILRAYVEKLLVFGIRYIYFNHVVALCQGITEFGGTKSV